MNKNKLLVGILFILVIVILAVFLGRCFYILNIWSDGEQGQSAEDFCRQEMAVMLFEGESQMKKFYRNCMYLQYKGYISN